MQPQFANQFLHWSDAYFMLQGAINTIELAVVSCVLGTILGVILGWFRSISIIVRVLTAPIIDVLRSVPMIIQLILANSALSLVGFAASPFWFGSVALGLWMAAVTAEVTRDALGSVPFQYRLGARSLGMNYFQELCHISGPLSFRAGLPSWIGLVLSLIKDSSLAGVIGYVEFTRSAQMLMIRTHETWLMLLGIGLFYFVICYPVSKYSRQLESKVRI